MGAKIRSDVSRMRCSASDSEAVHRWSGTVAKAVCVTVPCLQRIISLRSMLRSARDTSDLAPMGLDPAMTDVVAGILRSFERGNRLVLMPEFARRLRLVAR